MKCNYLFIMRMQLYVSHILEPCSREHTEMCVTLPPLIRASLT